jgi:hypothetical protein
MLTYFPYNILLICTVTDLQTAEPTDFQNVSGISFLPANFTIDKDNFLSITENSLVVLDDFSFKLANNKQAKINFLKVVNYILRHKNSDPGHTQFV